VSPIKDLKNMQFFKHEGQWVPMEQIRKIRERLNSEKEIFCPFCVSKAQRHTKECPTKLLDFNPETAHKLTLEERDEILKQRELINNK
jgi:hypothetical protein